MGDKGKKDQEKLKKQKAKHKAVETRKKKEKHEKDTFLGK